MASRDAEIVTLYETIPKKPRRTLIGAPALPRHVERPRNLEDVMCDYSLELYRSRPAVQEEQYTLHRFPSGTMGFTSARDCETAVCMPADARLQLAGIAEAVQRVYAVGPVEDVVITRMEGGTHVHRDAVRFANGREVLLQSLNAGLTAVVTDFPSDLVPVETVRHPTRELVDA